MFKGRRGGVRFVGAPVASASAKTSGRRWGHGVHCKAHPGGSAVDIIAADRSVGDRLSEAFHLTNQSISYSQTGRLKQAQALLQQSLFLHRELGSRRGEGIALVNLGDIYFELGLFADAERCQTEALPLLREVRDRRMESLAIGNLAEVHRKTGRLDLSERAFADSLAICRDVGDRRMEGSLSCAHAVLLVARGRVEHARETWALRQIGDLATLRFQLNELRNACSSAGIPAF